MQTALRVGLVAVVLSGCSQMPTLGPSSKEIDEGTAAQPGREVIQVVDIDDAVARQLLARRSHSLFSETLGAGPPGATRIGRGDLVEVTIWEAPPATLFNAGVTDARALSGAGATMLPAQTVGADGTISVPFAGRVRAGGRTTQEVGEEIARRLKDKANHPEALVRVARNESSMVTVVGEVAQSIRLPLTSGNERLLDALAAAGGVRQPVSKVTVQVTRGSQFHALPLDQVIRDPKQNVPLQAGDVVTALFQPLSFNVLGATGRQQEVDFETQGISLAQALARAGGLVDNRSDAKGLFIFRFEARDALDWPSQPVATTPEGRVPVVYRMNLRDPKSFFVMQSFAMNDKDILYVSTAPTAELQKFLNVVFSAVYPVVNLINATN
jgi:polysaccharide export outer membrane protein